jgi:hypothetical protein
MRAPSCKLVFDPSHDFGFGGRRFYWLVCGNRKLAAIWKENSKLIFVPIEDRLEIDTNQYEKKKRGFR